MSIGTQWGTRSTGNTSTATLANGATFTGVWELNNYPDALVTLFTDQLGSLVVNFSHNGVDTHSTITIAVAASVPEFHRIVKGSRFFRVSFTNNSGNAQTSFSLATSYGSFGPLTSTLNGTVSQDADAIVTRPYDFDLSVSLDRLTGIEANTKFGRNFEIDTTTDPEDVWGGGGLYTGQPVTIPGEKIEVFSSDVNDTSAGTGARTLTFEALDDDLNEVTETLSLNGTTGVQSTSNISRLARAFVATAGTGGQNAGALTIRHVTTTANVFAVIPVGLNQTQICAFTVPADCTAVLRSFDARLARASGAAGSATCYLLTRAVGGVYRVRDNLELVSGGSNPAEYLGLVIPEKTDVVARIASVSDNDSIVTARINYFLIAD